MASGFRSEIDHQRHQNEITNDLHANRRFHAIPYMPLFSHVCAWVLLSNKFARRGQNCIHVYDSIFID